MALNPFIARHVNPGEPLTAQAWNDVVDGVDGLHKHLAASSHAVRVTITTPGVDLATVRVTATRTGAPPVEAVRPVSTDTTYFIPGLVPGAYTVRAEAPGYAVATGNVTITEAAGDVSLDLALTATHVPMPTVFGMTLTQARTALGAKAITVSRLLDTQGKDLPPSTPGPEYDLSLVLVQSPPPGTLVPVGGSTVALAVAVAPKIETTVEVPSMAGLTLVEAKKALEAMGLVLGKVQNLQK
ncbi:carboxypeptidase-like regulatory domain-containing protein [Pyxidicoccus trucidator]|uniref:carboxypeptidase-like regulatory domain-containing protein n=1 Tax=Pyxidicoccus trucidator TaxID=2709662 RepID=UPI0013DBDC75|nr:carboxypeptidase-like regulatory domain-containing protein [Pyxidicoccus trucidator]